MKKIAIVIPTFNEGARLKATIIEISEYLRQSNDYEYDIVVIDDASSTSVRSINLSGALPIHLITHPVNLGQGAALETGFSYCRENLKPDFVVTVDADGQHNHKDIPKFLSYCEDKNLDIVFGNRFSDGTSNVPIVRRLILKVAMLFERYITGLELNDSHNGFRVFNANTLSVLRITQNRMAHATEIKQIVSRERLKFSELPTTITYSEESLNKGQSNAGSLIILRDLLKHYLFERNE